ncbi:restriction enzyme BgcI subunit alpha domain protein [Streptococcus infantis SPAR10]|uniref:Restriction enzyme BgcI subunit alpha domain protein n=1 Tax=Streptococcus infantis SPAR10 TaxID=1159208 RepID=J1H2E6_9STRE|nr:restriction enzyme BgcI subunit alpha domain protein [Streptococcus infantis SPAR10]
MAKKEVNTDLWVHELLKEAGIRENFDAQGSNIKEIDEALKTASKKGTGNSGFPEYVGIVKDFLIIIEDKPGLSKHINYTDDDLIADDIKSNTDYAVNGAVFYAKHLADKVSYKKLLL